MVVPQLSSTKEREALAYTLAHMVQVPASFDECHAAVVPPSGLGGDQRIEFTIAKDGSPESLLSRRLGRMGTRAFALRTLRISFSPATREDGPVATHAFLYIRFHAAGTERRQASE